MWSGKEQSGGAEGPSLNLQLTHGTSRARPFHHSVQMENEEKTQIRISLRNPDAFQENKQGSLLSAVSVSLFLCQCVCVRFWILGVCVLVLIISPFPFLLLPVGIRFRTCFLSQLRSLSSGMTGKSP